MIHSKYTLEDTIPYMTSEDYKERFMAEYWQNQIRYEKLHALIVKVEAGTLGFEPPCPLDVLVAQKANMGRYLHMLEIRAEIEGIDVNKMRRGKEQWNIKILQEF